MLIRHDPGFLFIPYYKTKIENRMKTKIKIICDLDPLKLEKRFETFLTYLYGCDCHVDEIKFGASLYYSVIIYYHE